MFYLENSNKAWGYSLFCMEKGITLIALVVTIIILLIVATVSINVLINEGIIGKAKSATFKSEIKTYEEELKLSIYNEQIDKIGQRIEKINIEKSSYSDAQSFTQAMQKIIPSFKEKYSDKLEIKEDELIYVGFDEEERTWIKEAKSVVAPIITINYIDEYGKVVAPQYRQVTDGGKYSIESPVVEGYLPIINLVEGEIKKDTTIDVEYCNKTLNGDLIYKGLDIKGNETEVEADILSYEITGIGSCTNTSLVIPEEYKNKPVTKIKKQAFQFNNTINNVIITNTIKTIENHAFDGSRITKINIDSNNIGVSAFQNCKNLQTVVINYNVNYIDNLAFGGSINLKDFMICSNQLNFSGENRIFAGGNLIEKIDVNSSNKGYTTDDGVLYTKDKGKLILYPPNKNDNYKILDSTKEISTSAFADNKAIMNFNVPDNVEIVGHNAFRNCKELNYININSKRIENASFAECNKLEDVAIGENVQHIVGNSFYNCVNLHTVTI